MQRPWSHPSFTFLRFSPHSYPRSSFDGTLPSFPLRRSTSCPQGPKGSPRPSRPAARVALPHGPAFRWRPCRKPTSARRIVLAGSLPPAGAPPGLRPRGGSIQERVLGRNGARSSVARRTAESVSSSDGLHPGLSRYRVRASPGIRRRSWRLPMFKKLHREQLARGHPRARRELGNRPWSTEARRMARCDATAAKAG